MVTIKRVALRNTKVPTPCPTPNPTFGKTNKPTNIIGGSTNEPTIKNSIIETSSPTGKPSPCSTDNMVGIPGRDPILDDDLDREESDDTNDKESDDSNNEETDNNQLHIIVVAILCIMIVAIIIYFHITKNCYYEIHRKFGFVQKVPTKDTIHKTISSEPSAPIMSNKI